MGKKRFEKQKHQFVVLSPAVFSPVRIVCGESQCFPVWNERTSYKTQPPGIDDEKVCTSRIHYQR